MANRMERFTQRARRVLSAAQEEASRLKHNAIGAEHLLIGLMRVEGGVAERAMKNAGLELSQVRACIEHLTSDYTRTPGAQMDLTDDLKKVLECASEEAKTLNHPYIGTEHLLLGMTRNAQGLVSEIFNKLNINPDEITNQTQNLLQELPPPPTEESATEASFNKMLGMSPSVRKTLIYAAAEARKAKAKEIETEHLLLGLMREHEQFINAAVLFLKITPDDLRKMILEGASKKQNPGE